MARSSAADSLWSRTTTPKKSADPTALDRPRRAARSPSPVLPPQQQSAHDRSAGDDEAALRLLCGEPLPVGALAGDYIVRATLAHGGCGSVYEVVHQVLGRAAALKVLHAHLLDSEEMRARFVREARAMSRLHHPNIVDVYGFGQLEDGRPYYVMELLEGITLDAHVRVQGRLAPREALELLEPACQALRAAHEAGVIHRDLKASNIFLARFDCARVVKLLDFGIAKLLDGSDDGAFSTASRRLGTPCTMAPEQIKGAPVDARTDVYALGVLLYQLVTGELPFSGRTREDTEQMHLEAPAPRASQHAPVPPSLDAVIWRALEKRPERRHGSVMHFLADLERATSRRQPLPGRARIVSTRAIGLAIEAHLGETDHDQPDDETLERAAAGLDAAERALSAAHFSVIVHTGSSLLAALPLPEPLPEPEQAQAQAQAQAELTARERALDLALSIYDLLAADYAYARLHFTLTAHADRVTLRSAESGPCIVGGPLLRLASWSRPGELRGPWATPAAVS